MVEFTTPAWFGIAAIAGLGVLAMLNAAASVIRNQTYVHDTRVRVNTLRQEYFGGDDDEDAIEVEVVDVEPAAPSAAGKAA